MIIKSIKLVLILLCMVTIFLFSNDTSDESTKKSDGVIINATEFFLGKTLNFVEKEKYIDTFVTPVRKSAHFLIYFVLGLLIISFLKEFNLNYKSVLIAILISFLYACSDEVHQMFVAGRSCEIRDVIIDTMGSVFGIIIYFICYTRVNRNKEKSYE